MCRHIVDNVEVVNCIVATSLRSTRNTKSNIAVSVEINLSVDVAAFGCCKYATFQTIADCIVEYGNATCGTIANCNLFDVWLCCKLCACSCCHCPSFTVDNSIWIECVNSFFNFLHCFKIVQSHKVKAEAIKLVFAHPV